MKRLPSTGRARIVTTVVCGVIGLLGNLVSVHLPWSDLARVRIGAVFALTVAGLLGPLWGGLAAVLGVLSRPSEPWTAFVEVVAAALAGLAVRRGLFVLPVTMMWCGLAAPVSSILDYGHAEWSAPSVAVIIGALVSAAIADVLLVLPAVGPRFGQRAGRRDLAAHFALALTLAGSLPLLAAVVAARGTLDRYCAVAVAIVALAAVVSARLLAARVVDPLNRALTGRHSSPRREENVYLEVEEVGSIGRTLESEREAAGKVAATLTSALADKTDAYEQLLRLSERLEERLELSGIEREHYSIAERHYRDAIELATNIVYTLDLQGRFTAVNPAGERFFGKSEAELRTRPWRHTLAPGYDQERDRHEVIPIGMDAVLEHGSAVLESVHRDATGAVRLLSSTLELLRDEDGHPFAIQGVAHDVTELERFQREVRGLGERLEALTEQLGRRNSALDAVLRAARSINSELEIDQLLQHIIESAAAQTHAESGFVGLLDGGALSLRWYWMSSGEAWNGDHGVDVERGVTRIVLRTRRPYFCADANTDPNTDKQFTSRFAVRSMLVFPIFDKSSEPLGTLALHNFPIAPETTGRVQLELGLEPEDIHFLEGLADMAAAAIQQSRLLEKVMHQAETDPLTGLYNRRAFQAKFAHELERAARKGRGLALVLLDIDHLKRINDTYGHPAGDDAIRAVADILATRKRRRDVAARLGGEEFAALVVDSNREQAIAVARNLCDAVRACDVPNAGPISASFGVATFPECGSSFDVLMQHADAALYRAKRGGRDRVEVAEIEDLRRRPVS